MVSQKSNQQTFKTVPIHRRRKLAAMFVSSALSPLCADAPVSETASSSAVDLRAQNTLWAKEIDKLNADCAAEAKLSNPDWTPTSGVIIPVNGTVEDIGWFKFIERMAQGDALLDKERNGQPSDLAETIWMTVFGMCDRLGMLSRDDKGVVIVPSARMLDFAVAKEIGSAPEAAELKQKFFKKALRVKRIQTNPDEVASCFLLLNLAAIASKRSPNGSNTNLFSALWSWYNSLMVETGLMTNPQEFLVPSIRNILNGFRRLDSSALEIENIRNLSEEQFLEVLEKSSSRNKQIISLLDELINHYSGSTFNPFSSSVSLCIHDCLREISKDRLKLVWMRYGINPSDSLTSKIHQLISKYQPNKEDEWNLDLINEIFTNKIIKFAFPSCQPPKHSGDIISRIDKPFVIAFVDELIQESKSNGSDLALLVAMMNNRCDGRRLPKDRTVYGNLLISSLTEFKKIDFQNYKTELKELRSLNLSKNTIKALGDALCRHCHSVKGLQETAIRNNLE